MKKIIVLLLITLLSPAFSATWWVDAQNGNNSYAGTSKNLALATIQAAADSVSAGDTVYIMKGLYTENIVFATSGTATDRITFKAFEDSVVVRAAGGSNYLLDFNAKDYITLDGLYFIGADSNTGTLRCFDTQFIYIYNCYFIIPDNSRAWNFIAELTSTNGLQFKYNVLYGDLHSNRGAFEFIGVMSGMVFEYNTFSLTRKAATSSNMRIFYNNSTTVSNTVIKNNIFYAHDSTITTGTLRCFDSDVADSAAYNANNNIFDYNIVAGFKSNFYPSMTVGSNTMLTDPKLIYDDYALTNYRDDSLKANFKLWGYIRKGSPAISASSDGYDIGGEPYVTIIGY